MHLSGEGSATLSRVQQAASQPSEAIWVMCVRDPLALEAPSAQWFLFAACPWRLEYLRSPGVLVH